MPRSYGSLSQREPDATKSRHNAPAQGGPGVTKKTEYLACYDYATGGAWLYLVADSPAQIRERFPDLHVVTARPNWLTDQEDRLVHEHLDSARAASGFSGFRAKRIVHVPRRGGAMLETCGSAGTGRR